MLTLAENFLKRGNHDLWQEKCQEILSRRKLTGNMVDCQENGRKSRKYNIDAFKYSANARTLSNFINCVARAY